MDYRILGMGKDSRSMNKSLQSFFFVARALRVIDDASESATLEAEIRGRKVDWKLVLRIADKENMTVALAAALRRRNLFKMLPPPVRAAVSRREMVGVEIGKRIRSEAEAAIKILNSAGVVPIAIKGVLRLLEAPPDGSAGRFMRDFDLIVPADKLKQSIDALRDAGYVPELQDDRWTYHYHPMRHPDNICSIELHIRPGEQRNFLTAEEVWADAVTVNCPGLQLFALSPNHRIAHNVFHSEIQDHGFVLGDICLRQLYDLALICDNHKNAIDWEAIDSRMNGNGLAKPFRARIHMAASLLGATVPANITGTIRSRIHLRRCLWLLSAAHTMAAARWIVGIAGRFSRYRIDLIYLCGTDGVSLVTHRIKHAWNMLRHHRGDLGARILEHGRRLR